MLPENPLVAGAHINQSTTLHAASGRFKQLDPSGKGREGQGRAGTLKSDRNEEELLASLIFPDA